MEFSTDRFTWDPTMRTFSADHSDLGSPRLQGSVSLKSTRTGKVERFEFYQVEERYPDLGTWTKVQYRNRDLDIAVTIFND